MTKTAQNNQNSQKRSVLAPCSCYSGVAEDLSLVGCDSVSTDKYLPSLRKESSGGNLQGKDQRKWTVSNTRRFSPQV
jgi:hypothetical protein